jgi:hypothetical protein
VDYPARTAHFDDETCPREPSFLLDALSHLVNQEILFNEIPLLVTFSAEASSERSFELRTWRERDCQLALGLTMTLPFMFG